MTTASATCGEFLRHYAVIRRRIDAGRPALAPPLPAPARAPRRRSRFYEPIVDKRITVPLIIAQTCEAFAHGQIRVTPRDVLNGDRLPEVIRVRHVAMFMARELTGLKMPEIGRRFGGMHHTSVLHATTKIMRLLGDGDFRDRLVELRVEIRKRAELGNVVQYD